MVIVDPLLCINEMLVSRISSSWLQFDDFIPSSQLENMKCTWLKFLFEFAICFAIRAILTMYINMYLYMCVYSSWVRILKIFLGKFCIQTLVFSTYVNFYQNPLRKRLQILPKKSKGEGPGWRHVYNGH